MEDGRPHELRSDRGIRSRLIRGGYPNVLRVWWCALVVGCPQRSYGLGCLGRRRGLCSWRMFFCPRPGRTFRTRPALLGLFWARALPAFHGKHRARLVATRKSTEQKTQGPEYDGNQQTPMVTRRKTYHHSLLILLLRQRVVGLWQLGPARRGRRIQPPILAGLICFPHAARLGVCTRRSVHVHMRVHVQTHEHTFTQCG